MSYKQQVAGSIPAESTLMPVRYMSKAELKVIDIDLHYRCPNCYLVFKLRNKQIPREKSIATRCPACSDTLTVSPVFIKVSEVSSRTSQASTPKDKTVCKAVEALKSQGYSAKEAKGRVEAVHKEGTTLAELIKGAIKHEQPS